ncbi:MAG: 2-C-methyl-D-erythritol 4-phosphate cytidylyltransferase [Muribaculaceae bacterium]|nr:2-C-methyl-D-erythritol 4-phosphate cytidylyltransferase [Muribaculaceae bacterium]
MNIAVIFAGGAGRRMHSAGLPKQFLEFRGKPIIIYTLELFETHPEIDAIVVASIADRIDLLNGYIKRFGLQKVKAVVPGGETGQDSITNALTAAAEIAPEDSIVLIHDGVRPLINHDIISENIAAVKRYGNCITCVPATETVIVRDEKKMEIPPRKDCMIARAPQSFRLGEILEMERRAMAEGRHDFIDCCSLMHHYGVELHTVEGSDENIKITTPTDFFIFKTLIDIRENKQIFGL